VARSAVVRSEWSLSGSIDVRSVSSGKPGKLGLFVPKPSPGGDRRVQERGQPARAVRQRRTACGQPGGSSLSLVTRPRPASARRPLVCKMRSCCRIASLTRACSHYWSARIGPRRSLLWSGLVVSPDRTNSMPRGVGTYCNDCNGARACREPTRDLLISRSCSVRAKMHHEPTRVGPN
jgi:hypothetical protein